MALLDQVHPLSATEPMGTATARAEARRDQAIRFARQACWAAIQAAYVDLERAEQSARDAYDAECAAILHGVCDHADQMKRAA
jgi:hypothetical protein